MFRQRRCHDAVTRFLVICECARGAVGKSWLITSHIACGLHDLPHASELTQPLRPRRREWAVHGSALSSAECRVDELVALDQQNAGALEHREDTRLDGRAQVLQARSSSLSLHGRGFVDCHEVQARPRRRTRA